MKFEKIKFDFKQSMEQGTLDLYIYSEVAGDSVDFWTGSKIESETSANYFRDKLAEFPDVKQINLYINSPGGSVREGYGIYSQLKRHPAHVTAYIDGFANSIASVIAMAADEIVMSVGSVMGIHNMMDFCFGNASEHRQVADNLDRMMEGNRKIYLQRSNGKLTVEKLTELMDAETILTAEECLEYGFCDRIEGQVADPSKVEEKVQLMNSGMASQIKYFSSLKQQFSAAMEAMGIPAVNPQSPPPEEKNLSTFLSALAKGGKE
ncbi:MAG: Clp protease ClpP [Oscillibacter sp.]|nr:Clp protease ClpP [Oscillibacter sp.]